LGILSQHTVSFSILFFQRVCIRRHRSEDPLSNHIQTVVHYLKTHKSFRDELRLPHQIYFSIYLVARCWPKMRKRINSWSSRGYIFALSAIGREDLEEEVSANFEKISAASADRHNRELAKTVAQMVRNGEMENVIMRPPGRPEWDLTLITSLGGIKQDAPQHKDNGTYDVTTCFDFHQLLIATLLAYGSASKNVNAHKGKGTTGLVEQCRRVWVCGNLLGR
jgi:hypothetical protein